MKPEELYKRKPEKIERGNDIAGAISCDHIPEIGEEIWTIVDQTRIEVHLYKDACFDGRRSWTLAAVKFDGEFIMITQNAGREGCDYRARFITNQGAYNEMVSYLRTLIAPDPDPLYSDVVSPDKEIPELADFYGSSLDGFDKEENEDE